MTLLEIKVPDIGDFKDVSIIEILVKPGEQVKVDQSLLTVESDKASMEIPCSHAGIIKELRVKIGDKVNEGTVVLTLESALQDQPISSLTKGSSESVLGGVDKRLTESSVKSNTDKAPSTSNPTSNPTSNHTGTASNYSGAVDFQCDLLVLGGGPGGYSAAFRAADLGLKVVVVERYSTLGGVCLNVGCIPSKALLHVAAVMDEASHMSKAGITFAKPTINLEGLRSHKQKVVDKLTGGLGAMAKMRKVQTVRGLGSFLSPHHLSVEETTGSGQEKSGVKKVVGFKSCIIAAGSQSVKLPFMPVHPLVVDSTGALELKEIPKRMLILGGGIIGLEMGTVYSSLGARLDVVEMMDGLMQGADRDLVKVWQKMNAPRFDNIMLKTKTVAAKVVSGGIEVSFEGEGAPKPQIYDLVLQAVGRSPNGLKIAADKAGVQVTERGFVPVDIQMRTNVPHIFAIGDLVGQPMLAHKAVHEAHVAAEVIAGELLGNSELARSAFNANVIPSVAYTDPEIAWVGLTEDQAKAQGIKIKKGLFPWNASGRAIANGRDEGFTKLLFDDGEDAHGHGKILGGGIVGTHAGDMIGEVALAIEMGADAVDIGKTIHPHPTLGESIGMAAEVAHGSCTDLPPLKR
jgi:dihydrolipoamide dehydrogenase